VEQRLLALSLVLGELSVDVNVASVENRKVMQKAVYLAQEMGVPLGYRFNWYVMGPYSPGLTDDYYQAATENGAPVDRALLGVFRNRLETLKPFLDLPDSGSPLSDAENLSRADWLELLASWHFLRAKRKLTRDDARKKMDEAKPRLAPNAELAEGALRDAGLLAAPQS